MHRWAESSATRLYQQVNSHFNCVYHEKVLAPYSVGRAENNKPILMLAPAIYAAEAAAEPVAKKSRVPAIPDEVLQVGHR